MGIELRSEFYGYNLVVLHEGHEQEDPHLHELPQHWFGLVDVEVEVWLEVLLAPHIFRQNKNIINNWQWLK